MTGAGDVLRTMTVSILDVVFTVEFGAGVGDADADRIAASWASCTVTPVADARAVIADVGDGATEGRGSAPAVLVLSSTVAQLEESLTSRLTIEAIGLRRHDLLMLHACGLAAPDGRVLAFVAASGTGKTTIARALGTRFGYVSDETVGVTSDGRVLPYPKPLSVKPLTGSAPKAQLAPGSLGLRPLPEAPLVLAGVVLLDRREGVDAPRLEAVDPIDAIDDLVPQTSYLSARPRPITHLVRTLTELGGVRRLIYSEAERVVDLVEELFASTGGVAPQDWHDIAPLDPAVEKEVRDGVVVREQADDALLLPGGELVLFHDNRLVRLSGIGPAIWNLADGRLGLDALLDAVLAEVGAPPPGVDPVGVLDAALDELVELGLIASGAPPTHTPDGVHA